MKGLCFKFIYCSTIYLLKKYVFSQIFSCSTLFQRWICFLFLLIIISLVSYRFLAHGSYELELQSFIRSDKGYSSMLFLAIVPCFYLYYKHLALPKLNYSFTSLKHFAFIIFLYVINANEAIQNSFIFYYGNITNFILLLGFIIFYVILR